MERKNLSQILKDAKIDYRREYDRLYQIFYELGTGRGDDVLRDSCARCFWNMPMRGTCLSLDDFDEVYGIKFEKDPEDFDLNYLLNFYDDTYYPEKLHGAGKAVYVKRNYEMIRNSKCCIFYYDEQSSPATRKSGTKIAFEYAVRKGKNIINIIS